jgi:hypothetical protein
MKKDLNEYFSKEEIQVVKNERYSICYLIECILSKNEIYYYPVRMVKIQQGAWLNW